MAQFIHSPNKTSTRISASISFSQNPLLVLVSLLSLYFSVASADTQASNNQAENGIKQYSYEVVNVYPHDPTAFTQGMIFKDGYLYESTGLNGGSSLRKVELETGKVLQKIDIDRKIFAEGLASVDGQLYQLSWRARTGFVYNTDTFALERTFKYPGQGWGLTFHKDQLIMSDGTSILRFLGPADFKEIKKLAVSIDGKPLRRLNELEMVKGDLLANVWLTDRIAIISPETGHVDGIINLAGLLDKYVPGSEADVLNGIAYDAAGERLFVTGKYWPKLFEIKIIADDL
ncbi:MAG: glutaminyl-peptide cyclotransferase [Arenicellales bacterium]